MGRHKSQHGVRLRKLTRKDLPQIYAFEQELEGHQMAVVIPRSPEAFESNWTNILQDETVTALGIVFNERLAGHISCFQHNSQNTVGYWIGREYWGQGIATRALQLFLDMVPIRPLYAHVATSNAASVRVLEKCGFNVIRHEWSEATERFPECEETILELT